MRQFAAGINSHEAWHKVRAARTYKQTVARANEWLEIFWRDAQKMGLSRRGRSGRSAPKILIKECDDETAGSWDGVDIVVPTAAQNLTFISEEYPVPPRDYLRSTILHEAQHALDTRNYTEKSGHRHDATFRRRVKRLESVFPPTAV